MVNLFGARKAMMEDTAAVAFGETKCDKSAG